ncbi:MAG: hypothetical protein KJ060_10910 [Candidatus Hydrogenedentes bacterium]|nr:hypothetical protein [Candidatus Hydrogenedentota bacterium]
MANLLPKLQITVVDDAAGIVNLKTMGRNGMVLMPPPPADQEGGTP